MRPPNIVDRGVVLAIGAFNLAAARLLAELNGRDGITFAKGLWPWWFAAAGALCVLYAFTWSPTPMRLAGSLTTVAYAGRCGAVVYAIQAGTSTSPPGRVGLVAITWAVLATVVAYVWVRVLRPLTDYWQVRRGR